MKKVLFTLLCAMCISGLNATDNDQIPEGYVDLGLPSGTLWKINAEEGFFTHEQAMTQFGAQLPTKEQFEELKDSCQWTWKENGYTIVGTNGNSIVFSANGYKNCDQETQMVGTYGGYWSSSSHSGKRAWDIYFNPGAVNIDYSGDCIGRSIRLVFVKK